MLAVALQVAGDPPECGNRDCESLLIYAICGHRQIAEVITGLAHVRPASTCCWYDSTRVLHAPCGRAGRARRGAKRQAAGPAHNRDVMYMPCSVLECPCGRGIGDQSERLGVRQLA